MRLDWSREQNKGKEAEPVNDSIIMGQGWYHHRCGSLDASGGFCVCHHKQKRGKKNARVG